jgi:predicted TIM-barrel fold metal-dependent hydrolase
MTGTSEAHEGEAMTTNDLPYIVVSSDTHAGAQMLDYKPYLPSQWHERFDLWAANFSDGWANVDEPGDLRMGVSSYLSAVNWESDRRISDLEGEGIAAEVVYPNTVPPFFPAGVITAAGPRNQQEYDARWEGIKAHNRWLVDFCAMVPGRRAGLAQMLASDIDNAIAEAKYAKEHGLSGILLPANHFELLNNWFLPKYDPLWRSLQELELPIHCHSAIPSNAASEENGPASPALGLYEGSGFSKRPLAHFILAGVFDRFPGLKLVMTESMAAWIPPTLQALDSFCKAAAVPGSITNKFGADAVSRLSRKPSEYFSSNCYAASYLTGADIALLDQVGADNIMWGSDYPHHEGTWPYTHEAYRSNFAALPEATTRKILGSTAIEVYNLDANLLQKVADRVGPRPSDVQVPLADSQWPTDSLCPTFLDRADMEAIYTAKR